jgi:lycopene cyclase-like protein
VSLTRAGWKERGFHDRKKLNAMHEAGSVSTYAYLLLSTSLLVVWLLLYGLRPDLRRQILWISLGTMPLGLTEPSSSRRTGTHRPCLTRRTGFDVESLLFSFATGGIVFAAYDALARAAPAGSMRAELHNPRHRYHLGAVMAAPAVFLVLLTITKLNPIYAAALGLVAGFMATLYCRPDLWAKMLVSGALFLLLYFGVFVVFNMVFPGYVAAVWNLPALTRIFVAGVPLEELMFAFTFGLYWSSVYEHLAWKRSRRMASNSPRGVSAKRTGVA